MLQIIIMLGACIGLLSALAFAVVSYRKNQRRRISRAHREVDYAQRQSQWNTYQRKSRDQSAVLFTDSDSGDCSGGTATGVDCSTSD